MMPNVTKRGEDTESIIFSCSAGCDDYLKLYFSTDKDWGAWANVATCCSKLSLWQLLKHWWIKKDQCSFDISLDPEDLVALRDKLTEHLAKTNEGDTTK